MARYYRRRRGWGRRRYFRRRFGAGGGNRKRPSSYAVAYGYTKQFDKIISEFASSFPGVKEVGVIYSNLNMLSLAAKMFFESGIDATDTSFFTKTAGYENIDKGILAQFGNALFSGVLRNHAVDDKPFAHTYSDGVPDDYPASYGSGKEMLIQVLKVQLKDALQRVTKRNLPFSLAVSSWCLSYLKNKKRRRKFLNFWKFKSVPRFMILLTYNLKEIWGKTKYGLSLDNILSEVDFVKQTAGTRRLLQLAKVGVTAAQTELARLNMVTKTTVPTRDLDYNKGLGDDVIL